MAKRRRKKLPFREPRKKTLMLGIGFPWFELVSPGVLGIIRMYREKDSAHNEVNLNPIGIDPRKRYRLLLEEYD